MQYMMNNKCFKHLFMNYRLFEIIPITWTCDWLIGDFPNTIGISSNWNKF